MGTDSLRPLGFGPSRSRRQPLPLVPCSEPRTLRQEKSATAPGRTVIYLYAFSQPAEGDERRRGLACPALGLMPEIRPEGATGGQAVQTLDE